MFRSKTCACRHYLSLVVEACNLFRGKEWVEEIIFPFLDFVQPAANVERFSVWAYRLPRKLASKSNAPYLFATDSLYSPSFITLSSTKTCTEPLNKHRRTKRQIIIITNTVIIIISTLQDTILDSWLSSCKYWVPSFSLREALLRIDTSEI